MPNVMAALQNVGGALCLTPQSVANAQYSSAVHEGCEDATTGSISAASRPKFTALWGHLEEI